MYVCVVNVPHIWFDLSVLTSNGILVLITIGLNNLVKRNRRNAYFFQNVNSLTIRGAQSSSNNFFVRPKGAFARLHSKFI